MGQCSARAPRFPPHRWCFPSKKCPGKGKSLLWSRPVGAVCWGGGTGLPAAGAAFALFHREAVVLVNHLYRR